MACLLSHSRRPEALALFEEMEEYFAAYAKSDESPEDFGKDILFQLCKLKEKSKKEFYMPLLEKVLSFNISLDVKYTPKWDRVGKTSFELCKKSGKWDIYEKLNLSQMGESLKG